MRFFSLVSAVLLPFLAHAAPVADFTLPDQHGKVHKLSDYKGKTVVLEWTNYGCPFVRKFYDAGEMQRLQQEALANDVVWLSIISSAPGKQGHLTDADAVQKVAAESFAGTAVLRDEDGSVGRQFGATNTPHMYVISPSQELYYKGSIDNIRSFRQSDIPNATNYVTAALESLKNGQAANPAETTAYGCSIKYAY